jgi:hypothetical protein
MRHPIPELMPAMMALRHVAARALDLAGGALCASGGIIIYAGLSTAVAVTVLLAGAGAILAASHLHGDI